MSRIRWDKIRWDKPKARISFVCSYCGAPIDDDDDDASIPIRMWKPNGSAAVFCDECAGEIIAACLTSTPKRKP